MKYGYGFRTRLRTPGYGFGKYVQQDRDVFTGTLHILTVSNCPESDSRSRALSNALSRLEKSPNRFFGVSFGASGEAQ